MCATCVVQGGPYVLGALVGLRVMGASAARTRRAAASGDDPTSTPELVAPAPATTAERRRPSAPGR